MVTEQLQGLPLWVLGMVQRLGMLLLDLWGLPGLGKVSGRLLGMVVERKVVRGLELGLEMVVGVVQDGARGLALRLEVVSGTVRCGVKFAEV